MILYTKVPKLKRRELIKILMVKIHCLNKVFNSFCGVTRKTSKNEWTRNWTLLLTRNVWQLWSNLNEKNRSLKFKSSKISPETNTNGVNSRRIIVSLGHTIKVNAVRLIGPDIFYCCNADIASSFSVFVYFFPSWVWINCKFMSSGSLSASSVSNVRNFCSFKCWMRSMFGLFKSLQQIIIQIRTTKWDNLKIEMKINHRLSWMATTSTRKSWN